MSIYQTLEDVVRSSFQTWNSGHTYPLYNNASVWDEWETRLPRYRENEYYYSNIQYDDASATARLLKEKGRLYINTRAIYNPVSRMVNLYADKIYPAMIDLENLVTGAIPVVTNDKALRASLIQLFRWSNWNAEKQLYVRSGEKLGDAFIKVVDDTESGRVVLEVLSGQKVRYFKKDSAGNIKEIWIEYYVRKDDRPTLKGYSTYDARQTKITEIITQDEILFYEDDKFVESYRNPFGFVPVVHAKPMDEGFSYGDVRWGTSKPKIDEINSQAALLNDQVRKAIIPYIATIGGKLDTGQLNRSNKKMDELINISVGLGGDVKMIAPNIDIASALNNIKSLLDELREDNPELFLYQLTDMSLPPSGTALRQLFELGVNRITSAQGVYDDALIRACQMAMTIGGVQGYGDFPYDLNSFEAGDLNFGIRPRDVIYDAIPATTRINILMSSGAPQTAVWTELGVSKETQEDWKAENKETQEEVIAAQVDQYNQNEQASSGNPNANIRSKAQGI